MSIMDTWYLISLKVNEVTEALCLCFLCKLSITLISTRICQCMQCTAGHYKGNVMACKEE